MSVLQALVKKGFIQPNLCTAANKLNAWALEMQRTNPKTSTFTSLNSAKQRSLQCKINQTGTLFHRLDSQGQPGGEANHAMPEERWCARAEPFLFNPKVLDDILELRNTALSQLKLISASKEEMCEGQEAMAGGQDLTLLTAADLQNQACSNLMLKLERKRKGTSILINFIKAAMHLNLLL
ncbi:hypothetical protein DFP72DRAFT_845657 [Ephemerocybe angulata]|uniref:Uncharacterized protein n=1 Tax=Ephemerocybe angulata TaxID=980116 RepID=A0A8H6I2Q7_9AGAR|nr:hypothetical protein DFP72DRAFT_845657 [Tulosesus angulatus]